MVQSTFEKSVAPAVIWGRPKIPLIIAENDLSFDTDPSKHKG